MALAASRTVHAQDTIFGFTSGNQLFQFQSNAPGTVTNVNAITGISGTLLDIDFRPANGLLYGLSQNQNTFSLYTISTGTGAATLVTTLTGASAVTGVSYGIDFDPVANALRIVGSNNDNLRVTAAQIGLGLGAVTVDTALSPSGFLVGAAYTNNVAGAATTTLYDIGPVTLYLQGGLNGTPNPNGGALTQVGSLGAGSGSKIGFDISGVTGTAYVTGLNNFFTVNLTTGFASTVGAINRTNLSGSVVGISAVTPAAAPEPGTLALLGMGLVGGAVGRRRQRGAEDSKGAGE